MSLQKWIETYEKKTKQKVEFNDGFHLFFLEDKGFCKMKIDRELDILMAKEICGDGAYWYKECLDTAIKLGISKMATFFCRYTPKIYARLFGGTAELKEDGTYIGKVNGYRFEAYPYNNNTYFVIQYLIEE